MKRKLNTKPVPGNRLLASAVLLFLLAICLYANTLGHEFVFDDSTLILQNPQVTNLNVRGMISGAGYRPVRGLSYIFNYYLGEDDPFGYHLFNVLLHGFNVVLLLFFVYRLTNSSRVSAVAGLVFCTHPVQTAAVAYVSGRKDLLATFFLLLGLILFLWARRRGSVLRMVPAFLSFILAVASKEVAIVFPLLLVFVDALYTGRYPDSREGQNLISAILKSISKEKLQYGLFAAIGLLALSTALFVLPASRMEGFWGGTLITNLGTSFKLFVHYLKMTVIPHPMIADYSGNVFPVSTGFLEPATLLAVLLTLSYFALVLWLAWKHPGVSLGLIWLFVTLLPVLQLIPFHELAADHFLYLPLAGFALSMGFLVNKLILEYKKPMLVWPLIVVLGVGSAWAVVKRNRVWKDPKTLWQTTLKQAPESYRANANLGQILMQDGNAKESIPLMKKSLEIDPKQSVSWTNLGYVYYQIGRQQRLGGNLVSARDHLSTAVDHFERARELDSGDPFLLINLGSSYSELFRVCTVENNVNESEKWLKKAETAYRQVLKQTFRDRRRDLMYVRRNFGGLYLDSGRPRLAIMQLERYLTSQPDDPVGYYLLGESHIRINQFEKAVEYLERSTELGPTATAWQTLAAAYEKTAKSDKAVEAYKKAVELEPGSPDIRFKLGLLYKTRGEVYFAIREFQQVGRLDPSGRYKSLVAREIRSMTEGQK